MANDMMATFEGLEGMKFRPPKTKVTIDRIHAYDNNTLTVRVGVWVEPSSEATAVVEITEEEILELVKQKIGPIAPNTLVAVRPEDDEQ